MEVKHIALVDCFSKEELEKIVLSSYSMKEVIGKLGYKTENGSNSNTIKKRLDRYNISTNHFTFQKPTQRVFENVFCNNSTVTQKVLRTWYKKISDDSRCAICGHEKQWNDKPLTMILDHINGNNQDNRLENLRWICPNCGSQLNTFAGRNSNIHNVEKTISK